MCGRFAINDEVDQLIREFVEAGGRPENWQPGADPYDRSTWRSRYNIRITEPIPVMVESKAGGDEVQRRGAWARWSLTPSWSKTLKVDYSTFNAKIETADELSSYKASVKSKRCVIPATGWYEFLDEGNKQKTPFFHHAPENKPLLFAGLYSWWKDPAPSDDEDPWHLTATILTTDSIPSLTVHDRAPVLLPRELLDHWLDATVVGDKSLLKQVNQAAVTEAEAVIVDKVAPLPAKDDGPELIKPVTS